MELSETFCTFIVLEKINMKIENFKIVKDLHSVRGKHVFQETLATAIEKFFLEVKNLKIVELEQLKCFYDTDQKRILAGIFKRDYRSFGIPEVKVGIDNQKMWNEIISYLKEKYPHYLSRIYYRDKAKQRALEMTDIIY